LGNNYVWTINTLIHLNQFWYFQQNRKTYFAAIQLLQFEKSQSETLANCYRNLAALNLQWRKIELANSYFKKANNYFSEIPNVSPQKNAKFNKKLLLFQKKYGEATEIISDVFKILIPNYSNRAFYPTQNPLCRNNFIGRT
jgi:tetratricopeptide (TPR) repeat protein